jgi:hypothetical protein
VGVWPTIPNATGAAVEAHYQCVGVSIAFLKFGNADNAISVGIPIGGGRSTFA